MWLKQKKKYSRFTKEIELKAYELYSIKKIVDRYMNSIEEVINIEVLIERFNDSVRNGNLIKILDEIILQTQVEFNFNS